jgi:hypothetical protein
MSDYSSPSPEDEVADAGSTADASTPFEDTDEDTNDDTVKAGSGTDEDTVSGGAPEPPD